VVFLVSQGSRMISIFSVTKVDTSESKKCINKLDAELSFCEES
jgi:hypothetical protein